MSDGDDESLIRAAGAVVWRSGDLGPDIVLVHRPKYDDWSYPKGKSEPGEHVLITAVREVTEEAALRVVLGRPLAPSVYPVGERIKHVSYWVARCVESVSFVAGSEVDQVIWVPAALAAERLSYERDVALLTEFLFRPPNSVPLILLRHAQAQRKSKANPGDLARPLDAKGEADAKLLASLLACYGRCRVISSAAERCLATVRSYAAAQGIGVEVEPAFTVPAGAPSGGAPSGGGPSGGGPSGGAPTAEAARDAATRRMMALASSGVPTLVCAHRENLPLLVEAAFGAFGVRRPDERPLSKGEFWVLQSADGALLSSERHDVDSLADSGQGMLAAGGARKLSVGCDTKSSRACPVDPRRRERCAHPKVRGRRPGPQRNLKGHAMADDMPDELEIELADLAERLTTPGEHECVRCYLIRMITEFGCDGTYRWTIRWRDVRAAQPRGLLRQFERRGGFCDCEVLMNVFPDYPLVLRPLPCAGVIRPGSARPCGLDGLGLRESA